MDNFLTWDVLGTFAGCVAGVVILTELLKKALPKITPLLISYVLALIILTVGQVVTGNFTWTNFVLNLVNAGAVSLVSNGGFDVLKKAFYREPEAEELFFDMTGDDTYLNLSKEPKDFTDGEVVTFKVHKVNSAESQE